MHWIAIVWSGFVATILAAAFLWVVRSFDLTRFSPTEQLGGLFLRDPFSPTTETVGFALLLVLGSTAFPLLYEYLFEVWRGPSAGAGTFLGLLHGLIFVAFLPALGTISASIKGGQFPAPGRLGLQWGWLTPVALLLGHLIYGGTVGAILAAFSRNLQGGIPGL